jgi:tubulin epsilon
MRFPGALNLDLNELASTLVPFPRLHFLTTALSPLGARRAAHAGAGLDALVADALARSNMLVRGNLRRGVNLACGVVLRGAAVAVSDAVQAVRRLGADLPLPRWNPDGFKVALCAQASPFAPASVTLVANSTGVAAPLASLYARFLALYRVRAHLHHYLDVIDGDDFQLAAVAVDGVIKGYEEHAAGR